MAIRNSYLTGVLMCGCLCAGSLWAGEDIVLSTGFRIHVDRHESVEDRVRIYSAGGVSEIPASLVAGYEVDDAVPAVAAEPVAPRPIQTPAADSFVTPALVFTPQALADD